MGKRKAKSPHPSSTSCPFLPAPFSNAGASRPRQARVKLASNMLRVLGVLLDVAGLLALVIDQIFLQVRLIDVVR